MRSFSFIRIAATIMLLCFGLAANAATVNYTLYIGAGNLTINGAGGTTLAAWGYSTVAGSPVFPGPKLMANEGDTVNVTVINNHNRDHNFVIRGVTTDATAIPAGSSRGYTFNASAAGTYIYYDTLNNNINREMGLYGALIVGPADGSNKAWTNGPAYSFQRTWILGDMDKPNWNNVAGTGGTVNTSVYKPNYFMINGRGGFDAMGAADTTIDGTVGQTALVRILNPGQYSESLHFHANHFQVLTVNGVRQSSPYQELDVINIPPLGTADVLFYLNQPGHYPMHVHTSNMETANGVYLNGVATMIIMH